VTTPIADARVPRRLRWPLGAAAAAILACAAELAARQIVRQSLLATLGLPAPSSFVILCVAFAAGLCGAAWLWWRAGLSASRVVALGLLVALPAGLAAQQQVGARLQSDGFFYFAFLRSLVNDRDVDLSNDYALIGVASDSLLSPTATGHAQSAWSVGPAIAWLPFYAVGEAGARFAAAKGADVALDGSSFPYRQAVCVAGLCYGLLGFWFCFLLAGRHVAAPLAALSTAALALGSFMTWYLVKEPTMSHATSMCVVAAFLYACSVTGAARTRRQWAALGLLGGFMLAVRWQNAIFMAFPAWDLVTSSSAEALPHGDGERQQAAVGGERRQPAIGGWRRTVVHGVIFGACALAAFAPQLAAWNAIYGSPVAVSPLSPDMRWTHPAIVEMLWSSRNGLFSSSPVTYLAAIGLVVAAVTGRAPGGLGLAVFALAVYVNASVGDWWGGSAFGARRFDGTIPLLVLGLAAGLDVARAWIARRPLVPLAAAIALLALWNVTAIVAALGGRFGGSMPQSFEDLAVDQVHTAYRWFGHPFSYPANLAYAARHGVPPASWDTFAFPMLGDPTRPYGKIDVGARDDVYLGEGWHAAETESGGPTFRWTTRRAELLVPLAHAAPLVVQLQVKPFVPPGASARVDVTVNGRPVGSAPLAPDWQRLELPTEPSAWRPGVNRVWLAWSAAAVPAAVGVGKDRRELGGMVDYLRVQVVGQGRY
jgi:hypothetical protein